MMNCSNFLDFDNWVFLRVASVDSANDSICYVFDDNVKYVALVCSKNEYFFKRNDIINAEQIVATCDNEEELMIWAELNFKNKIGKGKHNE